MKGKFCVFGGGAYALPLEVDVHWNPSPWAGGAYDPEAFDPAAVTFDTEL